MLTALLAGSILGSEWTVRKLSCPLLSISFGQSFLRWFPTEECVRYLKVSCTVYMLWVRQKNVCGRHHFPSLPLSLRTTLACLAFHLNSVIQSTKRLSCQLKMSSSPLTPQLLHVQPVAHNGAFRELEMITCWACRGGTVGSSLVNRTLFCGL